MRPTSSFMTGALAIATLACGGDSPVAPPPPPPPPAPAQLEALSPVDQIGPIGASVNEPPAVRVLDANGRPIAGVMVEFVTQGGSVSSPAVVTTGPDGIARVGSWRLVPGLAELRAVVPGLPSLLFRAEGKPRTFDLVVRWLGSPSPEAAGAVAAAEAVLEGIVWGDLPDQRVVATPLCALPGIGPTATIDEVVDDVLILAMVGPMDGPGGAGAQGFPCLIRDPGTQTVVGFIRLDEADFALLTPDLRREFALHEMVHAMGLVPQLLNITTPSGFSRACLKLPSTGAPNTLVQDSHFSCANAVAAFDRLGGIYYAGAKVPLENGNTRPLTANTLNHHWRKSLFRGELMTGWFTVGVTAPLSIVTAAALADLGYTVSYDGAEPFVLEGAITLAPRNGDAGVVELTEPAEYPPLRFTRRRSR